MISWTGSANALSATGIAVAAVGDPIVAGAVGLTENRPATIGNNAIKYFIPLGDTSGTYGVSGFGLSSDSGNGGGKLTMHLGFSPVSTSAPSTLTILFEDLDLINANDPTGFFESMRIFSGTTPLTDWITTIGGLVTGNSNTQQLLTFALGILPADPLYLSLKFKADFGNNYGHNTAEYLIATVTSDGEGPSPVPLPPAALLFGSILAGGGMFVRWRQKRATA